MYSSILNAKSKVLSLLILGAMLSISIVNAQDKSEENLQKFPGALGDAKPPVVVSLASGGFEVRISPEKKVPFPGLQSALGRSCDVQHNRCADLVNLSPKKPDFDVQKCDKQMDDCHEFNKGKGSSETPKKETSTPPQNGTSTSSPQNATLTSSSKNATSTSQPQNGTSTSDPIETLPEGKNLQRFPVSQSLGQVKAPPVVQMDGQFVVLLKDKKVPFKTFRSAINRSCDVQHNLCANSINLSKDKKNYTVQDCDKQGPVCSAWPDNQTPPTDTDPGKDKKTDPAKEKTP